MNNQHTPQDVFNAVVKDDVTEFSRLLTLKKSYAYLAFGRFPLLSIIYLYKARRIGKKFEEALVRVNDFVGQEEPIDAYKKFREVADTAIRFFTNAEYISPAEILLLTDDIEHLNSVVTKMGISKDNPNSKHIVERMEKIANSKDFDIEVKNGALFIPLKASRRVAKKRRLAFVASFVLVGIIILNSVLLGIIGGTIGLGTENNPRVINNTAQFERALSSGSRHFVLKTDINLTEKAPTRNSRGTNFSYLFSEVSANIDVNGHTITLSASAALANRLSGSLKNANFVIQGTRTLSGVINADCGFGLVVNENAGLISQSDVIVDATLNGEALSTTLVYTSAWFMAGVFARANNGTITDSTVVGDIKLLGSGRPNFYFGGFVGENFGVLSGVTTLEGTNFNSYTVGLAGIAVGNRGQIYSARNYAQINQIVRHSRWNIWLAGVVIINEGSIIRSANFGTINGSFDINYTPPPPPEPERPIEIWIGGVAVQNAIHSTIKNSKNYGDIIASGDNHVAVIGGIASINSGDIINSGAENTFYIDIDEIWLMFVGGIVAQSLGGTITQNFAITALETNRVNGIYYAKVAGVTYIPPNLLQTVINNNIFYSDTEYDVGLIALATVGWQDHIRYPDTEALFTRRINTIAQLKAHELYFTLA
ncbi:MAG: hypothetical protein FWB72_03505 [Firmicutes bacterium]|nr:hypothetical protein [Bacillota bacterium]